LAADHAGVPGDCHILAATLDLVAEFIDEIAGINNKKPDGSLIRLLRANSV